MRISFRFICHTGVFLLFFALTARAALLTDIWTGGAGSWTNAAKWSLGVVPNNTSASNYVALIANGSSISSSVELDPSLTVTINQLVLDAIDSLAISNNATLELTNSLTVNGTIKLLSSNSFTELEFSGGGTLGGTGSVVMAGFSPQFDIVNLQNGPVTNGPGVTIQGAGSVDGDCAFPLVNQGTITANLSNETLSVSCVANQGRLLATNGAALSVTTFTNDNNGTITAIGGTLQLVGIWSNSGVISGNVSAIDLGGTFTAAGLGTFQNVGGSVTLDGTLINTGNTLTLGPTTGGSWLLHGGMIQGGTVTTAGGAQLILPLNDSGTLDGVTLDTSLTISNNYDLYVTTNGVVLNSVTITLTSSNSFTELEFTGGGTLGGTGSVVMAGFSPQDDIVNFQNGPVTNSPGITIQGAGAIDGDCSFPLVNQGTISANLSNQTLAVSCFVNQGRLAALNQGTLELAGTWSNTGGVISNNASSIDLGGTFTTAGLGSIIDDPGTITLDGILLNTGSTLTLNATTGSWLLNAGTIRGGTLAVTGGAQLILPVGDNGTLDGVTLDTSLTISNNYALYVTTNGVVLNSVTITLTSSNNFTELVFTGGGALGGTGSVVMAGFSPQYDIVNLQNGPVTNGPGITIQGAGAIDGDCASPLVNQGTITANISNLTLSVSCLANQGRLLATNGAGLTVTTFTNDNNGTITATGGTLQLAGIWSNSGVISGNVSAISLGGTFTAAGLGTFQNVGGTVTLDGTLINTGNTLTLGPTTGGSWLLHGGMIQGGTVTTTSGAQLILPLNDSGTLDGVTLDTSLTISNNYDLYVTTNGVVLNSTTITLASSNNFTELIFLGGGTLGGTGSVVLAGFSPQDDILNFQNGPVTNSPGITIQGAGAIDGDCSFPLVNQGTISANLSNQTLAVSCFVNQGRLAALNQGTLELAGTWSNTGGVISNNASSIDLGGTFTTAGLGSIIDDPGTITLDGILLNTGSTLTLNATTGSWLLNAGTIRGGTLAVTGGAQLILPVGDNGTLDGVTLDTSLTISNNYALYVTTNGVVLNSVTITLTSSNNFTELVFTGGGTLGGTGSVVMAGFTPQFDILNLQNGPVTNGPGITIQGAGSIDGDCASPLVNQGTISADISNLTLSVSCLVNDGQLSALNGGILSSATVLTNFGDVTIDTGSKLQFQGNYVQMAGSTLLDGGQLTPVNGGSVLIDGGSLGGGGFVNAVVTNSGSIVPGPAVSTLVFSTNLVLNAGSTLNFQLGGSAPTQYGTAVLSNGLNLAGNLAVSLVNSFVPTTGSSFTVLTSIPTITGSFANITSGSPIETIGGAGTFTYIQNANSIVLENFQPGSQTNSSAYATWAQDYFGCTGCPQAQPNTDADGTGFSNTNKFLAGFNPINSAAYLHVISIAKTNTTDMKVIYLGANGDSSWTPGIASRTNVLEFTTGTASGSYSNDFASTGQTNILSGGTGLGIVTNMVDLGGATNRPARYYRIEVIAP